MASLSSLFQVGQTVKVRDTDSVYLLTVLAAGEPGQTVIEVGSDHVLLDDPSAGIQTRIPRHLIQAATTPPPPPTPAASPAA